MDIDWKLKSSRRQWPPCWKFIDVYPDELIIYHNEISDYFEESSKFLDKIFGNLWDSGKKTINLLITQKRIAVVFEKSGGEPNLRPLPLFKNALLQESNAPELKQDSLKTPIVAFYSYKGGVGRTLSLISLMREISKNKEFKTLIIDADIEAPGLTLMTKAQGFPSEKRISYSDILSIIHDSENDRLFNDIASNIAKSMTASAISIPANGINREHFFLPAYRFDYQQLDNYVHPESIISMQDRTFIISNFLSKLGECLRVNLILVDLRAGLSELSAPFLFDPRIHHVFVTTTSKQSIEGTKFALNIIYNAGFSKKSDDINTTILLNMIPKAMDNTNRKNIILDLLQPISNHASNDEDDEKALSDLVISSEFSDNLIHLEDLEQIDRLLKGSSIEESSADLSRRIISFKSIKNKKTEKTTESYRKEIIKKIHDIVHKEVTAEGTSGVQIMATGSLKQLARDYQNEIPRVVVIGAKGSGKTYLYKQLVKNLYWENFTAAILPIEKPKIPNTIIMPVLASANRASIASLLDDCFANINSELTLHIDKNILNQNESFLTRKNEDEHMNPSEWFDVWHTIFLNSLLGKKQHDSFNELDLYLSGVNKKLLFIFDGLEDVFNQTISSKNSQAAIKYLCQDFMKNITAYKNIGALVFIRSDMIKSSILTNFDQFESQYSNYALRWTQDEALRLVVWILAQVKFNNYDKLVEEIPKLTHEALSEHLIPFWGRKLGRDLSNEAFSDRWIIAALSDLKLQIQARDIIRFLESATFDPGKDTIYHDRILLPSDIRKAIEPCSKKKLEEIAVEMKNLKAIFDKLDNPGPDKKKELPIKQEDLILNNEERSLLESQGYLKLVDDNYYIPEIIRHALGYHYSRGARPKVLSLVLKQ
jgi:MinD-like ATPase involved in chromosome partitioning or flagellar assembly/GTPase SAR1 family protein